MHDNGQCHTQLGISILHGGNKMKKSYESNISGKIAVFIYVSMWHLFKHYEGPGGSMS